MLEIFLHAAQGKTRYSGRTSFQNCSAGLVGYLNWCKELKYDLNNMFFVSQRISKKYSSYTAEYQALQDKKAEEKKRQEEERIKREAEVMEKLLKELKENADIDNAFRIKGKGLILRVPKDAQEIRNEGAVLHHCVGTYVDRVTKGQTHILFYTEKKRIPTLHILRWSTTMER